MKKNYESPFITLMGIMDENSLLAGSAPKDATIRETWTDENVNTEGNSTTDEEHGSDGSGNSFIGF